MLDPSDVATLLLVFLVVVAVFNFPGGPGTPLQQKVNSHV